MLKLCWYYELKKDIPYLALMEELWGVFSEFFEENKPRNIEAEWYKVEYIYTVYIRNSSQQFLCINEKIR